MTARSLVFPEAASSWVQSRHTYSVVTVPGFREEESPPPLPSEILHLFLVNEDGDARMVGLCEIMEVKQCKVCHVKPEDLRHVSGGIKTREDLQQLLAQEYPEYRADINGDTNVSITTIKRFDYDLKSLNNLVGQVPKVPGMQNNRPTKKQSRPVSYMLYPPL